MQKEMATGQADCSDTGTLTKNSYANKIASSEEMRHIPVPAHVNIPNFLSL